MTSADKTFRSWEYARRGDYHRNIDPNWSYAPTYFRQVAFVDRWITTLLPAARILDIGCGEGVLVEKYAAQGRQIKGLDLNYSSSLVQRGDVLAMPYPDGAFEAVLLLDVLEHLQFCNQLPALREIRRILAPGGTLVAAIPNLAHFNSRVRMLLKGQFDRSDLEEDHPGERPLAENLGLLRESGFRIEKVRGITLTVPWLYRRVICTHAARLRWLHDLLNLIALPSLALVDMFVCRRE